MRTTGHLRTLRSDAGPKKCFPADVLVWYTTFSYRSGGWHLNHGYVHFADVGVQTAKFLKYTAAVHAREQRHPFGL